MFKKKEKAKPDAPPKDRASSSSLPAVVPRTPSTPPPHRLDICVVEAALSAPATAVVVVQTRGEAFETQPMQSDTPAWRDSHTFGFASPPSQQDVIVFDLYNVVSETRKLCLGHAAVSPYQLGEEGQLDSWIPMDPGADLGQASPPQLHVQITGHGLPSAPRAGSVAQAATAATEKRVTVVIRSASNLRAADVGGTSDPYVRAMLGTAEHTTSICKKTVAPVWNESCVFTVTDESAALTFTVFDNDLLSADDELGSASLPLAWLPAGRSHEFDLPLRDAGASASSSGAVLRVTAEPHGFGRSGSLPSVSPLPGSNTTLSTVSAQQKLLTLTLLEATLKFPAGQANPIARIKMGEITYSSTPLNSTNRPNWNEPFQFFYLENLREPLVIKIFHLANEGKMVELGAATLDAKRSLPASAAGGDTWLPLLCKDPATQQWKPAGSKLRIKLSVVDAVRELKVTVVQARNLRDADWFTKTDPAVQLLLGDKTFHTKHVADDLNPVWNESFVFPVDDESLTLRIVVEDADLIGKDKVGHAELAISRLPLNREKDLWLPLVVDGGRKEKGRATTSRSQIHLRATAVNFGMRVDPDFRPRIWVHVVEAEGLLDLDVGPGAKSDPYCVIHYGEETQQTRVIDNTSDPRWDEEFEIPVQSEASLAQHTLQFDLFDKDLVGSDALGSAQAVDLSRVARGKMYDVWLPVLLYDKVTLSHKCGGRVHVRYCAYDCGLTKEPPKEEPRIVIRVIEGRNLLNMDVVGKSDAFAVLELGGTRRQTRVIEDNLSPVWNEEFTFPVQPDSLTKQELQLEVWDRDPVGKDFLGRYTYPLAGLVRGVPKDEWLPLLLKDEKTGQWRLIAEGSRVHLLITAIDCGLAEAPPEVPCVHVKIVEAEGLPQPRASEPPILELKLCEETHLAEPIVLTNGFKTQLKWQDMSFPVGAAGLAVTGNTPPPTLQIDVYSKGNYGTDQPLGRALVTLDHLVENRPIAIWAPLRVRDEAHHSGWRTAHRHSTSSENGSLHLVITAKKCGLQPLLAVRVEEAHGPSLVPSMLPDRNRPSAPVDDEPPSNADQNSTVRTVSTLVGFIPSGPLQATAATVAHFSHGGIAGEEGIVAEWEQEEESAASGFLPLPVEGDLEANKLLVELYRGEIPEAVRAQCIVPDAPMQLRPSPFALLIQQLRASIPPALWLVPSHDGPPTLHVRLLGARNLRAYDPSRMCDSYCVLVFGEAEKRSGVRVGTDHPTWDEEFSFPLPSVSGEPPPLRISVFDKETNRDDELGRFSLRIAALPRNCRKELAFPILVKNKKTGKWEAAPEPAPKLLLVVTALGFGDPVNDPSLPMVTALPPPLETLEYVQIQALDDLQRDTPRDLWVDLIPPLSYLREIRDSVLTQREEVELSRLKGLLESGAVMRSGSVAGRSLLIVLLGAEDIPPLASGDRQCVRFQLGAVTRQCALPAQDQAAEDEFLVEVPNPMDALRITVLDASRRSTVTPAAGTPLRKTPPLGQRSSVSPPRTPNAQELRFSIQVNTLPRDMPKTLTVPLMYRNENGQWETPNPPPRLTLVLTANGFGVDAPPPEPHSPTPPLNRSYVLGDQEEQPAQESLREPSPAPEKMSERDRRRSTSAERKKRRQSEHRVRRSLNPNPHLIATLLHIADAPVADETSLFVRMVVNSQTHQSTRRLTEDKIEYGEEFEFQVKDTQKDTLRLSLCSVAGDGDAAEVTEIGRVVVWLRTLTRDTESVVSLEPMMLDPESGKWLKPNPPTRVVFELVANHFGVPFVPEEAKDSGGPPISLPGGAAQSTTEAPESSAAGPTAPAQKQLPAAAEESDNEEEEQAAVQAKEPEPGEWRADRNQIHLRLVARDCGHLERREVKVEVIEARHLPKMDWLSKSDPFARITLGGIQHKTRVIENTLEPHWREEFAFYGDDVADGLLHVEVLDRDNNSKEEEMGRVMVDLTALPQGEKTDLWLNLQVRDRKTGQFAEPGGPNPAAIHLAVVPKCFLNSEAPPRAIADALRSTSDPHLRLRINRIDFAAASQEEIKVVMTIGKQKQITSVKPADSATWEKDDFIFWLDDPVMQQIRFTLQNSKGERLARYDLSAVANLLSHQISEMSVGPLLVPGPVSSHGHSLWIPSPTHAMMELALLPRNFGRSIPDQLARIGIQLEAIDWTGTESSAPTAVILRASLNGTTWYRLPPLWDGWSFGNTLPHTALTLPVKDSGTSPLKVVAVDTNGQSLGSASFDLSSLVRDEPCVHTSNFADTGTETGLSLRLKLTPYRFGLREPAVPVPRLRVRLMESRDLPSPKVFAWVLHGQVTRKNFECPPVSGNNAAWNQDAQAAHYFSVDDTSTAPVVTLQLYDATNTSQVVATGQFDISQLVQGREDDLWVTMQLASGGQAFIRVLVLAEGCGLRPTLLVKLTEGTLRKPAATYAVIRYQQAQHVTKTIRSSNNPMWFAEYTFDSDPAVDPQADCIRCDVWAVTKEASADGLSPQEEVHVGTATLSMLDVPASRLSEHRLALVAPDAKEELPREPSNSSSHLLEPNSPPGFVHLTVTPSGCGAQPSIQLRVVEGKNMQGLKRSESPAFFARATLAPSDPRICTGLQTLETQPPSTPFTPLANTLQNLVVWNDPPVRLNLASGVASPTLVLEVVDEAGTAVGKTEIPLSQFSSTDAADLWLPLNVRDPETGRYLALPKRGRLAPADATDPLDNHPQLRVHISLKAWVGTAAAASLDGKPRLQIQEVRCENLPYSCRTELGEADLDELAAPPLPVVRFSIGDKAVYLRSESPALETLWAPQTPVELFVADEKKQKLIVEIYDNETETRRLLAKGSVPLDCLVRSEEEHMLVKLATRSPVGRWLKPADGVLRVKDNAPQKKEKIGTGLRRVTIVVRQANNLHLLEGEAGSSFNPVVFCEFAGITTISGPPASASRNATWNGREGVFEFDVPQTLVPADACVRFLVVCLPPGDPVGNTPSPPATPVPTGAFESDEPAIPLPRSPAPTLLPTNKVIGQCLLDLRGLPRGTTQVPDAVLPLLVWDKENQRWFAPHPKCELIVNVTCSAEAVAVGSDLNTIRRIIPVPFLPRQTVDHGATSDSPVPYHYLSVVKPEALRHLQTQLLKVTQQQEVIQWLELKPELHCNLRVKLALQQCGLAERPGPKVQIKLLSGSNLLSEDFLATPPIPAKKVKQRKTRMVRRTSRVWRHRGSSISVAGRTSSFLSSPAPHEQTPVEEEDHAKKLERRRSKKVSFFADDAAGNAPDVVAGIHLLQGPAYTALPESPVSARVTSAGDEAQFPVEVCSSTPSEDMVEVEETFDEEVDVTSDEDEVQEEAVWVAPAASPDADGPLRVRFLLETTSLHTTKALVGPDPKWNEEMRFRLPDVLHPSAEITVVVLNERDEEFGKTAIPLATLGRDKTLDKWIDLMLPTPVGIWREPVKPRRLHLYLTAIEFGGSSVDTAVANCLVDEGRARRANARDEQAQWEALLRYSARWVQVKQRTQQKRLNREARGTIAKEEEAARTVAEAEQATGFYTIEQLVLQSQEDLFRRLFAEKFESLERTALLKQHDEFVRAVELRIAREQLEAGQLKERNEFYASEEGERNAIAEEQVTLRHEAERLFIEEMELIFRHDTVDETQDEREGILTQELTARRILEDIERKARWRFEWQMRNSTVEGEAAARLQFEAEEQVAFEQIAASFREELEEISTAPGTPAAKPKKHRGTIPNPTEIFVDTLGPTSALITWRRPPTLPKEVKPHYRVMFSVDKGASFDVVGTTDQRTWKFEGLTPNTLYFVTVVTRLDLLDTDGIPRPPSRIRTILHFTTLLDVRPPPAPAPDASVFKRSHVLGDSSRAAPRVR
eukprot:TRINITY_DN17465_c0_g1_i1.p1 TRINITY_DN17465_c0_g1~~TRINITY_DN17465_c0_g1_i1.p1  ORF type:complete len:3832 (-),score=536.18 TRINITY_DN17465_c0_g1_i1:148-11643(-)